MKKCPFCAEEIQDEANVCEHCGRDLTVPQSPPKKKSALKAAVIGAGFLAVSVIIAAIDFGRPTSKIEALLPGFITGFAGWVAIILFIVAIVRAIRNRKVK